jgi:hypothetical protein
LPELLAADVADVVADCCMLVIVSDEEADDDVDVLIFGFEGYFLIRLPSNSLKGNLASRLFPMN